jgi:hypothetical protein
MTTWGSRNVVVYLAVELRTIPTHQVLIKTTEDRVGAKRRAIQGDIDRQQFSRWEAFAGLRLNTDYTIRLLNQDFSPYNTRTTK